MVKGIERRRHSRRDVPAKLLVNQGWQAVNLSESGMLIAGKDEMLVGSRIDLQLDLNGEVSEIGAVVRRCTPSASVYDQDNLVGVQFDPLSAAMLLKLRAYLETLP